MRTPVMLALVSTTTAFLGAGAGYIVAEKRLSKKFEERLEKETEGMREFYTATPAEKFVTPEEALAALHPDEVIVDPTDGTIRLTELKTSAAHERPDTQRTEYHKIAERYQAPTEDEEVPEETPRVETVTVEARNAFEQEKLAKRGSVYMISQEEFAEGDFISTDLTWYSDGVLTDSQEEPITPVASHIGDVTMKDFGYIPNNPDTILVRNEVMSLDFEITRSLTSYAVEVLGELPETVERPSQRGD